jgi:hypothetical protein
MAEEEIKIRVTVDGADQASRGLDGVTDSLGEQKTAADAAHDSTAQVSSGFADMARGGQALTQRVQGVASAVQQLVSATGSSDRSAGMIASVAGATAQFAALGATLGPGGAVAGGIAGFLSGMRSIVTQADAAAAAITRLNTAASASTTSLAAGLADVGTLSEDDVSRLMAEGAETRRGLMERERELAATMADIWAGPADRGAAALEIRDVRDRIAVITDRIDELNAATGVGRDLAPTTSGRVGLDVGTGGAGAGGASLRRSGGGGSGGGRAAASEPTDFFADITGESANDAADRINAELAANEEIAAARREFWDDQDDLRAESYAEEAEAIKEHADAQIEIEREKNDAIRELAEEQEEATKEKRRQALQDQIETQEEFMNLGMDVVGLLTDALGDIASGEKTAEQAFKGMAKAFLQMISQYTALKAATEFAEAIGAFARYDIPGGAAHLAAGIAFTAVAVATGVGAAAINTSKPTPPAKPEADRDTGDKGGGGVVINWNSPVVTASTRDDLGRELGAMVRAGDARYGSG